MFHVRLTRHIIILFASLISSVMLIFSVVTPVTAAYEAQAAHHILVLHSYHQGFPLTDQIMIGIQEVLSQSQSLESIHIDIEYMDVKRHPINSDTSRVLNSVLQYKLKKRSFDLVIVSGNEALQYALDHRTEIFSRTPIVSCGVITNKYEPTVSAEHTQINVEPDFAGLIRQAIAFHPKASKVIAIGGTHDLVDRLNTQQLSEVAKTFTDRIAFDFWTDVPAETIIDRLREVTPNTILFINGSIFDKAGNLLSFQEQAGLLRQARLPLYSFCSAFLGKGIVGGHLVNVTEQGRMAAYAALKILGDEQAGHPATSTNVSTFDFKELKRLGIPLDRLPANHVLINEPLPFYKLSKNQLLWLSALMISSISITLLLTWTTLLRRRSEAQLRQSEQKCRQISQQLQIILDGIPDNLILISADMKVQWSNKDTKLPFGTTLQTAPGEYCYELFYNHSFVCENCPAINAFQTGLTEESVITTTDDRVFEVKAFPVKDSIDGVSHVIMLASDITEKNRLLEEAARSRRLVALGELAAGVAHEINNPNALILFNASLVKHAYIDAAPILQRYYEEAGDFQLAGLPYSEMRQELPHLVSEMLDSAGRIKNIVNELKDFTFADAQDQRVTFNLNMVVTEVIHLMDKTIYAATNKLIIELSENIPSFFGNRQHIEQVLINLITNACQALPDKEKGIYISTRFHAERKSCVITVRDEGVGISKENMQHITDPFFTTKRQSGGTGLGLSISMRIANNYDGSLEFHSEVNTGTTVHLYLPVKQEDNDGE